MKILYNLVFTGLTFIILNSSNSCATEIFGEGENIMNRRFDFRLAEESIREEKAEAQKQGFEEGIEMGREENRKQVVKQMVAMGLHDNVIAEVNQITLEQLQELKASLGK